MIALPTRRGLLLGLIAAPVIIRTPGLIMPISPLKFRRTFAGYIERPGPVSANHFHTLAEALRHTEFGGDIYLNDSTIDEVVAKPQLILGPHRFHLPGGSSFLGREIINFGCVPT